MRRRDVAMWLGCLVLFGATTAWAQAPEPAGRAKLRARIAGLRTEIELLRMEHDAKAGQFKAALTDLQNLEDMESALPEFTRMTAELKARHGDGGADDLAQQIARLGPPAEAGGPPGIKGLLKEFDPERQQKIATDIDLSMLKLLRPMVERKKKEFIARATSLHEKSLELEDLERQYRGPAPAAILETQAPRLETSPPSDALRAQGHSIPILDPVPGDPPAGCCPNPPNEAEVLEKIAKAEGVRRDHVRVAVEKIGEKVDPCKVYPLAGPCQLVHCHYKATVSFDESPSVDGRPASPPRARTEVVYVDKDHLRRCGDTAHAHAAKIDGDAVVRAALPAEPATDPDRRMGRVEEKLDRILKALDGLDRDD